MTATTSPTPTTQTKLVEYTTYPEAQAAVDTLSDAGFGVGGVSIVWSRVRMIEYVTGRRTTATAARDGALSGAWFGGVLGLLLSLFVEIEEGASAFGLVLTYVIVGAVIGAGFAAFRHWQLRGTRDFAASNKLDAEAYEIWVPSADIPEASRILGVATPDRPIDPS